MKRTTFVAVLLSLLMAPFASATVLDFGTGFGGKGGLVADKGNGHIEGGDINIDALLVTGTAFDGVYNVDDGTGCEFGVNGSCGSLSFDTESGVISIFGSVPDLKIGPMKLLEGTITSFTFTKLGDGASFFSTGLDVKNPALLTALGVNPATPFAYFGFTLSVSPSVFDGACKELGWTCYDAYSTDILNTAVPEPGTLILLGSGLVGVARAARRRRKA